MLKMFLILISFALTIVPSAQAQSFEVLNPKVSQGDALIIKINPQWQGPGVGILFQKSDYLPNKLGYVYIGIKVDILSGKYQVFLTEYDRIKRDIPPAEIEIVERNFTEWFRGRSLFPSKAAQARLNKDREIKNKAYDSAELYEDYTTGKYAEPLADIDVRDEFGSRRIYGTYSKSKKQINIEKIVPHG